jgi:ubiquinone/menaquinone biosynthesis C-methylase UbiE
MWHGRLQPGFGLSETSSYSLDIEKKLLKEIGSSYIERIRGDVHNLTLRDSSVDCVLSFSLLELLKDPRRSVEELYRVLKYGGTAIIQLPNLQYPFDPTRNGRCYA